MCVGTQAAEARQDTAVVLVHSFGGGSFSWRLVMQALADRCGQRVIALDRPGFGAFPTAQTPNPKPQAPSPKPCAGQVSGVRVALLHCRKLYRALVHSLCRPGIWGAGGVAQLVASAWLARGCCPW